MKKLLGVIIVLLLTACAPVPTPVPTKAPNPVPEAIEIGATVPLTGKYAAGGAQVRAGYEFAMEDINASGGILVKEYNQKLPLRITVLDDGSDPTKTASNLETLSAERKVVAYLGGFGSDLHLAAVPVAEKNKTPYLGVAFASWKAHQQGYKYLFSTSLKSPDITKVVFVALNDLVTPLQRPTKVAIFAEKTDWGNEMGSMWKQEAGQAGYSVVAYEEYAPGTKDYADLIGKAKTAGAELVLASPSAPDGVALVKQMATMEFNPKFVYFQRAPDADSWATDASTAGDYVGLAPGWYYRLGYPGVQELNAKHQAKFGRPADVQVGTSYATVQLLAAAIENAGKLDSGRIRDALASVDKYTVMGRVRFRSDGTAVLTTIVLQWQGGKLQIVYPRENATAAFLYPAPAWGAR